MATLISAATATGAGVAIPIEAGFHSVTAYGTTSAGSGASTINIEVSNVGDSGTWITVGTVTLTLATTVATGTPDGIAFAGGWKYVRANVTAISGTDAAVTAVVM